MSNLLLEYNFAFKVHCIYLLQDAPHIKKRQFCDACAKTDTWFCHYPKIKESKLQYPSSKKESKDNKTQQQNAQRENVAV